MREVIFGVDGKFGGKLGSESTVVVVDGDDIQVLTCRWDNGFNSLPSTMQTGTHHLDGVENFPVNAVK